jgi:hypothetical protein
MSHRPRFLAHASAFLVLQQNSGMVSHAQTPSRAVSDSARIRIVFPGVYARSPAQSRLFSLLSRIIPPTAHTISSPKSFDELILERYRISEGPYTTSKRRALPALVDSLRRGIAVLNGVDIRADQLPTGTYLLPSMPPQTAQGVARKSLTQYLPDVSSASGSLSRSSGPTNNASLRFLATTSAGLAPTHVLELTVPRGDVGRITATLDSVPGIARYTVDAPTPIRFGIPPLPVESATPKPMSTALRTSLARAFGAAPVRTTPLVILDAGWPTDSIAQTSCDAFAQIITEIQTTWKIPRSARPLCSLGAFDTPPSSLHTSQILEAAWPEVLVISHRTRILRGRLSMSARGASAFVARHVVRCNNLHEVIYFSVYASGRAIGFFANVLLFDVDPDWAVSYRRLKRDGETKN